MTYEPARALADAGARIDAALAERQDQIDREARQAHEFARRYADHLAAGSDPLDYPTAEDERSWKNSWLVSPYLGLEVVYDEWNRARPRPNPHRPFRNTTSWRIGEAFLASIGTPIPYADLAALSSGSVRAQSDQVARVAFAFERPYDPDAQRDRDDGSTDLVARKTKVAGKVAFLVRERRPDDRVPVVPDAHRYDDRYYSDSSLPEERWTP